MLENVKGLLSHDEGKTFQTILGVLSDLGYRVEWQVLNSKHFGVPQNRERVFIVGHLGNGSGRKVFPIGENNQTTTQELTQGVGQADRVYNKDGLSPTVPTSGGGRHEPKIGIDLSTQEAKITKQARSLQARYWKGYSHRKAETTEVLAWSKSHRTGKTEADKRRYNYGKVEQRIKLGEFNTLNTGEGCRTQSSQNFIKENMKIRRLTPTECERLQGFPDGWTEGISDTQRYKCLGNAVTTNVIEAIGKRIAEIWITKKPPLEYEQTNV